MSYSRERSWLVCAAIDGGLYGLPSIHMVSAFRTTFDCDLSAYMTEWSVLIRTSTRLLIKIAMGDSPMLDQGVKTTFCLPAPI
jgi:hypothetical protein